MQLKPRLIRSIPLSLSSFILTATLLSCTTVKIKDHEFCGDKGTLGAACFHTLTNEKEVLTREQWDDRRFGQICTMDPPDQIGATFADWEGVIETLCSSLKDSLFVHCKYEDRKKLKAFLERVVNSDPATARVLQPVINRLQ